MSLFVNTSYEDDQPQDEISHGRRETNRRSQSDNSVLPDWTDEFTLKVLQLQHFDAGQEIDDQELAAAMKQSGLGTPATPEFESAGIKPDG